MRENWLKAIAGALLPLMILSACAASPPRLSLDAAQIAGAKGATEVRTELPALDSGLTQKVPHAPEVEGDDKQFVWEEERRRLTMCNVQNDNFELFYNTLRRELREGSPK